jgi:hypothetical protein
MPVGVMMLIQLMRRIGKSAASNALQSGALLQCGWILLKLYPNWLERPPSDPCSGTGIIAPHQSVIIIKRSRANQLTTCVCDARSLVAMNSINMLSFHIATT